MNTPENKVCQNCKTSFTVEPEDFAFYEKIKVPPPTFCPECRRQRRMTWRNERALYKRNCDLCHKEFIGIFPPNTPWPVYCRSCWFSDQWEAIKYGVDYDWSKPFFTQFAELLTKVPRLGVIQQGMMVNSDFTNCTSNNCDCYLIFASNFNERCAYGYIFQDSKDCFDGYGVNKSELCYECIDCLESYKLSFSQDCTGCRDSAFLFSCRNCSDCFLSSNLVNKKFYILNKPYSKEDYPLELKKITSRQSIEQLRGAFEKMRREAIVRYMTGTHNIYVSGDWLSECKNTRESFRCRLIEDGKYLFQITEAKNCMDYHSWGRGCELMYEVMTSGYQCYGLSFTHNCWDGNRSLQYCDSCHSSSDLFGCIGLRNKQHCVFNRQYKKDEYEKLVAKIIDHMKQTPYTDASGRIYRYGEFFPAELSPFAYNETIAQEYFPSTKEEAAGRGYRWKDSDTRDYRITKKPEDLPDRTEGPPDSILQEIIGCAHRGICTHQCTTAFRIISEELAFYRRMNLSLPHLCPNCRHYERLAQRNPLKLWHRKCMCAGTRSERNVYRNTAAHFHEDGHCPHEFETSYAPERVEIVYCEQCYQSEVV